jgi:type IV secretion system protein VirB4
MAQASVTSEFPLKGLSAAEDWLPKYVRHVTPQVIRMDGRQFLVILRVTGVPFESVSDVILENNYDNLTRTISGLGRDHGSRLAIWTTFMRRRVRFGEHYRFENRFARVFMQKYLQRFRSNDYFENSFYISLILKYEDYDDGLKDVKQLAEEAVKALRIYDAECLETYERNGIMFSQAYSFLGELWNGVEEEVPVTATPARVVIPTSWIHANYDSIEIRNDVSTKFGACYDLKDFPKAGYGQLNPLLALPVEFTITQSFTCMTAFDSNKAISDQINKLESSGDKARHQMDELRLAQGYVSTGELAFGDYHGALVVYGDTAKAAIEHGNLVTTRSKGECGMVWAKANASAPWTYASQMPGSKVKPRPQPKSSRSLASTFTLHDYSSGKSRGNPIGDGSAVIPLQTVSKKLYNFNYHATREDESNTGEKIAGHTMILGSTGTGKTVLQLVLASSFLRFDPMMFGLDVGRGMEIFFRQIGGTYIPLQAGVPTGFSPFELPDTPMNRQFLYDLVTICCKDEQGKITAEEKREVQEAVDTVMSIDDVRARRFSRLLESIEDKGGNSLFTRLSAWCASEGGRYAWVFDNPPGMMPDVTNQRRVAFDVTTFAREGYEPSEAVFSYIFYLKQLMQREGRLMMSIVEEFWLPLKYEKTRAMIEAVLAAGRKAGEFLVLVSQQPEQAIASPVFPQIRSLTATKVFLPDPEAEYEAYKRCNLSEKEFDELKKLHKSSRTFLVKQSTQSAFATLDLHGFDDEIAVLSSSPENVLLMEQSIAEFGDDPDVWLEPFQERVYAAKLRAKLMVSHGNEPDVVEGLLARGIEERRQKKAIEREALDRLAA